jgi:hypothetical protein
MKLRHDRLLFGCIVPTMFLKYDGGAGLCLFGTFRILSKITDFHMRCNIRGPKGGVPEIVENQKVCLNR